MATLHDLVIHDLNLEAGRTLDWLPEIPEGIREEPCTQFPSDKHTRKQLRLLANSAVEILRVRAEEESWPVHFSSGLRRVRRMDSRVTAKTATSRLLRLYDWKLEENGQDSGTEFHSAAMLADMLLSEYNGWRAGLSQWDATGYYAEVVGVAEHSGNRQKLVTSLLVELKKMDTTAARDSQ